jgi:hypothetical protein
LNALIAEDNNKGEDGGVHARMNPLQVRLNAIKAEAPTELMYVPAEANSVESSTILDTSATHNFVATRMVEKFGLKLNKCPSQLKAVNSEVQPVTGIAYLVHLKVGECSGKVNFLVVPLDDFDVILGDKFFVLPRTVAIPFVGGLLIMDDKQPCFERANRGAPRSCGGSKDTTLSVMQLKHGLRSWDVTYLTAMREVKEETLMDVPEKVVDLLEEFGDVMPPELPKTLLPSAMLITKSSCCLVPNLLLEPHNECHQKNWCSCRHSSLSYWRQALSSLPKHPLEPLCCSRRRKMAPCACVWTIGP